MKDLKPFLAFLVLTFSPSISASTAPIPLAVAKLCGGLGFTVKGLEYCINRFKDHPQLSLETATLCNHPQLTLEGIHYCLKKHSNEPDLTMEVATLCSGGALSLYGWSFTVC